MDQENRQGYHLLNGHLTSSLEYAFSESRVPFSKKSRPLLGTEQTLGNHLNFQNSSNALLPALPDSDADDSWVHHDARFAKNSSFTEKYLAQLRRLLETIFDYRDVGVEDIEALNSGEKAVLRILLLAKNYEPKAQLVDNLYLKNERFDVWGRFHKAKRKEENLKYGFKLILKHLQATFREANSAKISNKFINQLDNSLMFYMFYFGHLEFGCGFEPLVEMVNDGLLARNKLWATLGKYILPEMGLQSSFSSVKSINKNFLINISRSAKFRNSALSLLLDSVIFLGYCRDGRDRLEGVCPSLTNGERIGSHFLKTISKTNAKEIKRLFKEWENQVFIRRTYIDIGCPKSIQASLEVIKKNASRKNLKFPWTFFEVRMALIECFLTLLSFSGSASEAQGRIPGFPVN